MPNERTDVVDELRTLIAFPTVSSRPVTAIASHLATRCEALGFRIERFDDPVLDGKTNIIATLGPADAPGGLLLSGHMDVVPVANQPWTSDPFVLTEREGRLHARGSADMKGFIAATTVALERIDRRTMQRPLVLVWTHDEEVGCHGSAHLAQTLLDQHRTLPRDCLIGEPTGLQVLRMHAGHVAVRVTAHGAAAHSAFPELGSNAIEAAATAIDAMCRLAAQLREERSPQPDLERDFVPLNVGVIRGGSAVNIVPDACVFELGYRPLPGAGHEAVLRRIEVALAGLTLPSGTSIDCHLIRVTPSLCTPADTPLASHLLTEAATPGLGAAGFATDGGNLARCGAEPLVFGPGSIQVAHQANEFIEELALRKTVGIVERLILARCCQPLS